MPEDSLVHFADEVSKLMPDILREFLKRQAREVAQGNVTLPQILILDALKDKTYARMGELAKYLSVSMAATTGIADKLVRNGLARRTGSPDDRRIVNISITAKGKKIIEKYNQARYRAIMEMFGGLSSSDRDKYLQILSKIHNRIK